MSSSPVDNNRIIRKRKAAAIEDTEIAENAPPASNVERDHEFSEGSPSNDAIIDPTDKDVTASSQATEDNDVAPEIKSDSAYPGHSNDEEGDRAAPKFRFRQRVYAKDSETGLFYEGIVRRASFGVQYQRQIKLSPTLSEEEFAAALEQDMEPTWWYYIHYLGWRVQWDRWVAEGDLYEATESTKLFAKRLLDEVKTIKAELRSKSSGKPAAARVAKELERRMTLMEREHRMEERRRELAAQGKVMEQAEADALLSSAQKSRSKSKWNKANIDKEIALRQRHLQGKRSQSSAELLVLPFTLKKILVEEWEIVTQSNMLASLPAAISIRQALDMYLNVKLEAMRPAEEKKDEDVDKGHPATEASASKEEVEWREMVDGICLFFDQALPERLLYQTEHIQYELMLEEGQGGRRWSDVYGCEFLLRLFLRLPALLVGELSESESKSILAKLNDLVRFLQKHHTTIFTQSYRRWNEMEQARKDESNV